MCIGFICFYPCSSSFSGLWRPRSPSYQTSPWQPCILRCLSCCVEQFAVGNSYLHHHCLLSKIALRLIYFYSCSLLCSLIFIDLIRAVCAVRRPCGDFTDMLRRPMNCRFVIIIIIIIIHVFIKQWQNAHAVIYREQKCTVKCEGHLSKFWRTEMGSKL